MYTVYLWHTAEVLAENMSETEVLAMETDFYDKRLKMEFVGPYKNVKFDRIKQVAFVSNCCNFKTH